MQPPDWDATPLATAANHPSAQNLAMTARHLVASVEPAVVFGSLARLCVPSFSDDCHIDVMERERAPYRVESVVAGNLRVAREVPRPSLGIRFHGSTLTAGSYSGLARFVWNTRTPTVYDHTVAGLLIDRAVAVITQERLQERIHVAEDVNSHLRTALQANRRISMAIGILMSNHAVTEDVAWEILRTDSQTSHHKISDIADDIVRAGCTNDR
jgi:hypothetical protein